MTSLLTLGQAALAQGEWDDAVRAFEAALAERESGEGRDGLGHALWWKGEIPRCLEQKERAYVAYVERGDHKRAAMAALFVSTEQASAFGNHAVANGWYARVERLLQGVEPCPELARLVVRRAQRASDPKVALALFEEAIAMSRSVKARDMELLALSCAGCLLVGIGETAAGFTYLDEAMTATVAGELSDHQLVALTSCNMLIACERAHDVARATEWLRVSADWAKKRQCLPFFAFCRVAYGAVRMAQGRFAEAEDELVDSIRRYEDTHPALASRAAVKLAELRVAQGQLDEAEALLGPWKEQPAAACARASLHLARGETELAVSLLERRLGVGAADLAMTAQLGELLVHAHLERGEHGRAEQRAKDLATLASEHPGTVLAAIADAARGEVATARGDAAAPMHLQRALDAYATIGMPYAAARVRLCLARALAKTQKDAALAEAQTALVEFEALGCTPCAERATKLIAETSGRAKPAVKRRAGVDALTKREREVLVLLRDGKSNPDIARALDISAKTAEHHVCAILAKIGVTTRAAAAAWAARQEKDLT